jgi:hypothetical protein
MTANRYDAHDVEEKVHHRHAPDGAADQGSGVANTVEKQRSETLLTSDGLSRPVYSRTFHDDYEHKLDTRWSVYGPLLCAT